MLKRVTVPRSSMKESSEFSQGFGKMDRNRKCCNGFNAVRKSQANTGGSTEESSCIRNKRKEQGTKEGDMQERFLDSRGDRVPGY